MPFPGIENLIGSLGAFDAEAELKQIVQDNVLAIRQYILQQLAAGKDGNDEPNKIFDRTEYAPLTIKYKKEKGSGLGAVTDYVTNYMTGAFYASIKINVEGNIFEADSDVPYFGDIRLYSSAALLEINKENRLEFAETITLPEFAAALKAKTGLSVNGGNN